MNALRLGALLVAWILLALPLRGQGGALERVSLRVTGERAGGVVVIDRGAGDGLVRGDRIVFQPKNGARVAGSVSHLDDRGAFVKLEDPSAVLAPGTRGFARVPISRFEVQRSAPPVADAPEHAPWENRDEDFTSDQPLLAQVRAVRPERRPRRISGRTTVQADHRLTGENGRSDGFYRLGADVLVENPLGRGGELHIDAEANHRFTQLPQDPDEYKRKLRVDRLSYVVGGTRFSDRRYEGGRFLQHGMPEFGVLDGFEYSRRLANGHRWGASAGFMPEPDLDYDTGKDFQLAAWYEWVADKTERLSAAAGYQKSWHNTAPDRDLIVGRLRYLPDEGWNFHGATWIDVYSDSDDNKGAGLGLTQAYLSTGRRWKRDNALNITYSHLEFAEIDRFEFTPVTAQQLADDHRDRLALTGTKSLGRKRRMHTSLGGWIDEDDNGSDASLGLGLDDLFAEESDTDFTLFATAGEFATVLGARISHGRPFGAGRWDLSYEITNHDQTGFQDNNDDIPQHRVRASTDWLGASGWSLHCYGDVQFWDDEGALTLGFHFSKSF